MDLNYTFATVVEAWLRSPPIGPNGILGDIKEYVRAQTEHPQRDKILNWALYHEVVIDRLRRATPVTMSDEDLQTLAKFALWVPHHEAEYRKACETSPCNHFAVLEGAMGLMSHSLRDVTRHAYSYLKLTSAPGTWAENYKPNPNIAVAVGIAVPPLATKRRPGRPPLYPEPVPGVKGSAPAPGIERVEACTWCDAEPFEAALIGCGSCARCFCFRCYHSKVVNARKMWLRAVRGREYECMFCIAALRTCAACGSEEHRQEECTAANEECAAYALTLLTAPYGVRRIA